MSNKAKKTQAPNAMKSEAIKESVEKTNEESAAAAQELAAKESAPAAGAPAGEGSEGVVDKTGEKLPDSETQPGPDQRAAETGTKSKANAKAAAQGKPENAGEGVEGDEPEKKTLKDRDLSNPQDVSELVEEILEGVVSLGHPLSAALQNKPRVNATWDEVVQKARAVQGAIDTLKNGSKK